jgi:hypothetical protein
MAANTHPNSGTGPPHGISLGRRGPATMGRLVPPPRGGA